MSLAEEELLAALNGLGLSHRHGEQVRQADATKKECAAHGASALEDEHGADLVRAFVRPLAGLATTEHAMELLASQRLYVVRSGLCNACAVAGKPSPVVLVFSGLLKAIIFVMEFASVVHRIAQHVESCEERAPPMSVGELHALGYAGYSALYHHVADGHPLPRLGDVITSDKKAGMLIQLARVLWFVIAHEIGHIRLGHLDTVAGPPSPLSPSLALDESMDEHKLREFEADLFLCSLLRESEQHAVLSYVLAPLDMFAQIERNLMLSRGAHPMSLNRLFNILAQRKDVVDEGSMQAVAEIVTRNSAAAQRFAPEQDHYAARVSPDDASDAIRELKRIYASLLPDEPTDTVDRTMAERALLWDHAADHFAKAGTA